jgi:dTMP kinase
MQGRFITFEGIEGVGKSTQLVRAAAHLRAAGIEVVTTREPGGTPLAEKLRQLVLEPQGEAIDGVTELLIMFAARSLHLANLVEPALARGAWVLCDRFTDATEAYQGGGRGVPVDHVHALERIAQRGRRPDLTLLLDAPVQVAMTRMSVRGTQNDRFESEHTEFFERVRAAYLSILAREPDRVRRVDAEGRLEEVTGAVTAELDRLLSGELDRGT